MYEDDRDFPETVIRPGDDERETQLREHTAEVTITELRRALAVLAVLEMADFDEEPEQALLVH